MVKIKPENDYGEITLEIRLSPSYYLYIRETNTKSKNVELSQYNIFWYSNQFSFSSSKNIVDVIVEAFEKSYKYINSKSGEVWERGRMEKQMNESIDRCTRYINSNRYNGKWIA